MLSGRRSLMLSGTVWSISASREETPIAANISRVSVSLGPMCRGTKLRTSIDGALGRVVIGRNLRVVILSEARDLLLCRENQIPRFAQDDKEFTLLYHPMPIRRWRTL